MAEGGFDLEMDTFKYEEHDDEDDAADLFEPTSDYEYTQDSMPADWDDPAPEDLDEQEYASEPDIDESTREYFNTDETVEFFYRKRDAWPDTIKPNYDRFFKNDGGLYYKTDKGFIRLTFKNEPTKFLKLGTIEKIASKKGLNGRDFIRNELRFKHYKRMPPLTTEQREALSVQPESIPLQELPQTTDNISDVVQELTTDQEVQTEGLTAREIDGLREADRRMQTIRGELENNLAKLNELDRDIENAQQELLEAMSDDERREIKQRLADLKIERQARLEALSTNRRELASQINRIKETIYKIMESDTTLREKIRTLFREQGVTIVSILAAISLAISTLVSSIVASVRGAAAPTPNPTPKPPESKSWIKKQLEKFANALKKLGISAVGALPGVIGSILSWILNLLSKTVGWLAENLWALFLSVGAIIYAYISTNWNKRKRTRKK